MYLNTFETIHFHFLQIPCFQTLDSLYQALALAIWVKKLCWGKDCSWQCKKPCLEILQTGQSWWFFFPFFWFLLFLERKKLSRNFRVFWNNRRLIGGCLYSLVLARGLFLKRFPSLIPRHCYHLFNDNWPLIFYGSKYKYKCKYKKDT